MPRTVALEDGGDCSLAHEHGGPDDCGLGGGVVVLN